MTCLALCHSSSSIPSVAATSIVAVVREPQRGHRQHRHGVQDVVVQQGRQLPERLDSHVRFGGSGSRSTADTSSQWASAIAANVTRRTAKS